MKPFYSVLIVFITLSCYSQKNSTLKGKYLGQQNPGLIPEKFAPGIITTNYHEGCSGFLFDENIFVFQRYVDDEQRLYEMELIDNTWTEPKFLEFSVEFTIGDLTIAQDGKTMVFATRKDIPEIKENQEGANIFKVVRNEDGWGTPEHLGLEVNTKYHDSYPCLAENGTLYFFSRRPGGIGKSDLYTAELIDGKYTNVTNMGENFNTADHEWDTYIAPDESYMIFCSTKGTENINDNLYISFKDDNNSWSEPKDMGEKFNTNYSENRPYVTQDGKYFFFTSTRDGSRNIYWVDAKILEEFRP